MSRQTHLQTPMEESTHKCGNMRRRRRKKKIF
jgi:hypothetical protein